MTSAGGSAMASDRQYTTPSGHAERGPPVRTREFSELCNADFTVGCRLG